MLGGREAYLLKSSLGKLVFCDHRYLIFLQLEKKKNMRYKNCRGTWLVQSVGHDSESWGHEIETHIRDGVYFKKRKKRHGLYHFNEWVILFLKLQRGASEWLSRLGPNSWFLLRS